MNKEIKVDFYFGRQQSGVFFFFLNKQIACAIINAANHTS
jgi:hypothetical protein